MFEDAEVDAFLMRLNGPGDGVVLGNLDPANEIALCVLQLASPLDPQDV